MHTLNILLKQIESMWVGAVALLPSLAIAIVVLVVTWIVAKFAKKISDRLTARSGMRPSLQSLIETIIGIAIWAAGILVAATILLPGLTPSSLIAGLGVGTVAIGFAFQDIFENFLAGVLIMVREKMRIGDVIECQDITGKVEHILLRETHVRKLSGELSVVPNSVLFKNPVEILTDNPQRRHEIVAGVSYDTDLDEAQEIIRKAVEKADGVDTDKRIDVFALEFADSSINFTVRWWAGSQPLEMHKTRDTVIRSINRDLNAAGIEIPFPYITHTFKEPMRIIRQDEREDETKGDDTAAASETSTAEAE